MEGSTPIAVIPLHQPPLTMSPSSVSQFESHSLFLALHNLLIFARLAVRDIVIMQVPQIAMSDLGHIRIVFDIQVPATLLGPDESQEDHVHVHRGHEDADDLAVVVALDGLALLVLDRWKRVPLAYCGLDSRRG